MVRRTSGTEANPSRRFHDGPECGDRTDRDVTAAGVIVGRRREAVGHSVNVSTPPDVDPGRSRRVKMMAKERPKRSS
ncbi:hypothetical protein [Lyngbya sp. CCY1209]|uniref:hypothetical protein n=1 Tax=Lyngbya sp. CCY1209 TaxID=2886103 RepID=UPI002D2007D9|nr:hypothetical protein [Lyngbya sp. CCY1209]MEB3885458.1 hypothetical protein [Lyngbya sp. CCY1209]